jgi:hypothetical protein
MKRILWMMIAALLFAGVGIAAAQSVADAARSARKGKAQPAASTHHYDNDNLPTTEHLSVVGPAPANGSANSADPNASDAPSAQASPVDPKTAATDHEREVNEMKDKINDQKKTIDSMKHELDLTQREYRLKAVAEYSDAGNRLRNSAQWDKDEAEFKKQLEEKQKAIDAAQQDLENLQEQARRAGVKEREEK